MDLTILKKKINTYRTPKGKLTRVPDDLLGEILHSWEQWSGPASGFYKSLGVDYRKMGSLMGRAKKLKREGAFEGLDFTEVQLIDHNVTSASLTSPVGIEIIWANIHTIRFSRVDDLIYFLNKAERPSSQNLSDFEVEELEEAA